MKARALRGFGKKDQTKCEVNPPSYDGSNEQIFGAKQQVPHVGGTDQEAENAIPRV